MWNGPGEEELSPSPRIWGRSLRAENAVDPRALGRSHALWGGAVVSVSASPARHGLSAAAHVQTLSAEIRFPLPDLVARWTPRALG